jgi:hypothetical protein
MTAYEIGRLEWSSEVCSSDLSRAEQSRAEQSRAEQSRAEQSRAEQSSNQAVTGFPCKISKIYQKSYTVATVRNLNSDRNVNNEFY